MRAFILSAFGIFAAVACASAVTFNAKDWHLKHEGLVVLTGVTDGMTGTEAVTVKGDAGPGAWGESVRHPLAKSISLAAWRGQRVRVALRLKTEDEMRAYVRFELADASIDTAQSIVRRQDSHDWETHVFVVDVPRRDASRLNVLVGLLGKGAIWVDDVAIEPVDKQVALSSIRHLHAGAGDDWGNSLPINGDYSGGYTPPVSAPSPVGTGVINK